MWNSRLRSGGSPARRSLKNTSAYSASSSWTLKESCGPSLSIDLMSIWFPGLPPCRNKTRTGDRCLRSCARRCRLMVSLGSRVALIVMDLRLCLMVVAQPRSHGPDEGSNSPLPPRERAAYRITRFGKRGRQRYNTTGTVYLPATTVPPTVVALRPISGDIGSGGPIPLMEIGPRHQPTNTQKCNTRQIPECDKSGREGSPLPDRA